MQVPHFRHRSRKENVGERALGVDRVFEIVVLRTVYIRERIIQTVNEKSVKVQVAILKVVILKRSGFRRKSMKANRINFNRKSGS